MRLDILNEIEKRAAYYLSSDKVDSAYLSISTDAKLTFLIIPERFFSNAIHQKPEVMNQFYVAGIFDLGECYSPYVDLRFSLYVITKTEPVDFMTAIYNDSLYVPEKPKGFYFKNSTVSYLDMPSEYCETFMSYIEELEDWFNDGEIPQDSFYANYNRISYSEYIPEEPYAARYSRTSVRIIEKLKGYKPIPLFVLADIIEPSQDDLVETPVTYLWNMDQFEYPLKKEYYRKNHGRVPNFKLQKGDILFCFFGEGYQINYIPDDLPGDIYCPSLTIVVRAKAKVSSHYLFLYLRSEAGQVIIGDRIRGSVIKQLSLKEVENLPIIKPELSDKHYKKMFDEAFVNHDKLDVFSECYRKTHSEDLEDILNDELRDKALKCRNKLARDIIEADLAELNACFEAGAYKATLIMAGSIMEAFLIDWLSELEGKDFFSNKTKKRNGDDYTLCEIIDRIENIKKPAWMEESKKAGTIRDKRNLVHAKLCLNKAEKINDHLCKKVVGFLREIINSRYKEKMVQVKKI